MFKNPFSFDGRIRRLEYGLSYIAYFAGIFAMVLLVDLLGATGSTLSTVIILLVYIPLCWFLLAQGAKRCHDRGNNGIWQIIPFYNLWMLFADGEIGDNEYGENLKGLVYDFGDEDAEKQSVDSFGNGGITKSQKE